jgi:hypothetical protein
MRFLEIVRLIASLLPTLIEIIQAVEEAIPESGKGQDKLAMVRELLEVAHKSTGDLGQSFAEIWPIVAEVIDRIVALFNKTGVFSSASDQ